MKRKTRKNRKSLFEKKDFDNGNGMLTSIWGPSLWHFLHAMSFNYPVKPTQKDKKNYKKFYKQLHHVLPCGKCRQNFKKNLKKKPLTLKNLKNRETFSRWVFDIHELINKMLNKRSNLTYKQIRTRYEHFRARCKTRRRKNKEVGCSNPLKGKKTKCIIKIVPQTKKCNTFQMDKNCFSRAKLGKIG